MHLRNLVTLVAALSTLSSFAALPCRFSENVGPELATAIQKSTQAEIVADSESNVIINTFDRTNGDRYEEGISLSDRNGQQIDEELTYSTRIFKNGQVVPRTVSRNDRKKWMKAAVRLVKRNCE